MVDQVSDESLKENVKVTTEDENSIIILSDGETEKFWNLPKRVIWVVKSVKEDLGDDDEKVVSLKP